MIRTKRSSLRAARLIGPQTSSGTENLVSKIENLLPPVQARSESRSKLLAVPGWPTNNACSLAMSAVRIMSTSSSRSMSAAANSLLVAANFSWRISRSGRVDFMKPLGFGLLGRAGIT